MLGVTLIVGVMAGFVGGAAVGGRPIEPAATPMVGEVRERPVTTTTAATTTTTLPSTTAPEVDPGPPIYLVWASGGLDPALVEGLLSRFADISVVLGDVADLAAEQDAVIPLDAVALDPASHRFFDGGATVGLAPGRVLLSTSSARFREAEIGDRLQIEGTEFEVAGVVPDEWVGAAEIVFDLADPASPVHTPRYVIIGSDLERTEFEQVVRSLHDGPAPLRIRAEEETPVLRHGDAVLPQIAIKELLGEFSLVRGEGAAFTQSEAWQAEHLVTAEVPILGAVTCHRLVVDALAGAMGELADTGLAHLVDPSGYRGCYEPRFIRAKAGIASSVSRHAWGAAVDLNSGTNPVGSIGDMDPRVVEVMQRWGFVWGGDWLVPDPMHFEIYDAGAGA